jgi:hypothetical protein
MKLFYTRLKDGSRPAEALREIRRTVADRKVPAAQSAFVLVGD